MTHKAVVSSAIAGVIAMAGIGAAQLAQAQPAPMPSFEFEKCFGVALAGKNDCQTSHSACAGTAKTDGQADAWIYVPKGTCGKLVGGMMK